jgi:hypothetical protein
MKTLRRVVNATGMTTDERLRCRILGVTEGEVGAA